MAWSYWHAICTELVLVLYKDTSSSDGYQVYLWLIYTVDLLYFLCVPKVCNLTKVYMRKASLLCHCTYLECLYIPAVNILTALFSRVDSECSWLEILKFAVRDKARQASFYCSCRSMFTGIAQKRNLPQEQLLKFSTKMRENFYIHAMKISQKCVHGGECAKCHTC